MRTKSFSLQRKDKNEKIEYKKEKKKCKDRNKEQIKKPHFEDENVKEEEETR